VLPGQYFVLVETDSGGQVPDAHRSNNVRASATRISVDYQTLTLGGSVNGSIAAGQDVFFKLILPPGQNVQITGTFGVASAAELLVGYRYVPTEATFDQFAFTPGQSTGTVTLTNTQTGSYFIRLRGQSAAGLSTTFTLSAQTNPLGISAFSPTTVT